MRCRWVGGACLDTHISLQHARIIRQTLEAMGVTSIRVVLSHWQTMVLPATKYSRIARSSPTSSRPRPCTESDQDRRRESADLAARAANRIFEGSLNLMVGIGGGGARQVEIHSHDGNVLLMPAAVCCWRATRWRTRSPMCRAAAAGRTSERSRTHGQLEDRPDPAKPWFAASDRSRRLRSEASSRQRKRMSAGCFAAGTIPVWQGRIWQPSVRRCSPRVRWITSRHTKPFTDKTSRPLSLPERQNKKKRRPRRRLFLGKTVLSLRAALASICLALAWRVRNRDLAWLQLFGNVALELDVSRPFFSEAPSLRHGRQAGSGARRRARQCRDSSTSLPSPSSPRRVRP